MERRNALIDFLKAREIYAVFHYLSLQESPYYSRLRPQASPLPRAASFSDCLVRLPIFAGITRQQQDRVIHAVKDFVQSGS